MFMRSDGGETEKAMRTFWAVTMLAGALLGGRANAACTSPLADETIRLPGRPFAAEPSPDNCHLFVSLIGNHGGSVAVLDNDQGQFRLGRVVPLPQGSGGGVALSHDGKLLAVAAEDAIALLDIAKLETDTQDPIVGLLPDAGHGAIYTALTKDDAYVFVSEERNATVAVIDVAALHAGSSKAVVGRVEVGQAPVGLALSPDGTILFSTSEVAGQGDDCQPEQARGRPHAQGALFTIDVAKAITDPSHAVTGAMRAGCNPVRVVVAGDGHALWVSARGDGRIIGLDPAIFSSGERKGQTVALAVGKSPVGLALRPDGTQLWVADSDRFARTGGSLVQITPIGPAAAQVAQTFETGAFPRDLRFLPDGKTLVVALFGDSAVLLHPTDR
jgi:DNA-binding beta-propeller fold protein YncE